MPKFVPPRSNFLFQESLPQFRTIAPPIAGVRSGNTTPYYVKNPELMGVTASDYYRARHNLSGLWNKVAGQYFPGRPQPTLDPQVLPGGRDPYDKTPVGRGWAGLTWNRSENIPSTQYKRQEALPFPGTYALDPLTIAGLANPGTAQINPIKYAQPKESIGNAGRTAIHEWAHNFQNPEALSSELLTEGGAEAFARAVAPHAVSAAFGGDPHSPPWNYPAWTKQMQRLGPPDTTWDWISKYQFGSPKPKASPLTRKLARTAGR